jgi:Ca2+-binding RTX toxin-like protein
MASKTQARSNSIQSRAVRVTRDLQPPTATLQIADMTRLGSRAHTFTVAYSDNKRIDRSSLVGRDILVTGPNGYRQIAKLTSTTFGTNDRTVNVTYRLRAAGGTWDAADNGVYRLSMYRSRVKDVSGNLVRTGKLGSFRVNVGNSPNPVDPAPTVQSFEAPNIALNSGSAYIQVVYADNTAIDLSSLDSNDVRVTGPDGFDQLATFIRVEPGINGTPRTVTYRIDAPGGIWNPTDNGSYTITVRANQVKDNLGNTVVARTVGTFQVNLSASTPPGSNTTSNGTAGNDVLLGSSGSDTLNGEEGNDTADYAHLSRGIVANLSTGKVSKLAYGGLSLPKIMPVGDSITAGQHTQQPRPGSYRIELFNQLATDGISIDFVGSQSNGPSGSFDQDHEGHGGWTINQMIGLVNDPGFLEGYNPDIVLIMMGTNDATNDTVSQMSADIRALIDEFAERLPNAHLLVSSIAPINGEVRGENRAQRASDFNQLLPDLVSAKAAEGKRVSYVDVGGSLTLNDIISDGLHPNAAGYDKMGGKWYEAIAKQGVLFNGQDTLNSVENLVGTAFADSLTGSSGVNVLEGGRGRDRLTGGGGGDTFVYRSANEGGDTITDFGTSDILRISASGFDGGLAPGVALSDGTASARGVLVQGNTPVGNSANFLYNNGVLRFDQDGIGSGAAVAIATLTGNPTLSVNQISIVV